MPRLLRLVERFFLANGAEIDSVCQIFCRQKRTVFRVWGVLRRWTTKETSLLWPHQPGWSSNSLPHKEGHFAVSYLDCYEAILENQRLASHRTVMSSETIEVCSKQTDMKDVRLTRETPDRASVSGNSMIDAFWESYFLFLCFLCPQMTLFSLQKVVVQVPKSFQRLCWSVSFEAVSTSATKTKPWLLYRARKRRNHSGKRFL